MAVTNDSLNPSTVRKFRPENPRWMAIVANGDKRDDGSFSFIARAERMTRGEVEQTVACKHQHATPQEARTCAYALAKAQRARSE